MPQCFGFPEVFIERIIEASRRPDSKSMESVVTLFICHGYGGVVRFTEEGH